MKKLFWCSVAVAVTAASCVYLASRHVEHVPLAFVGQALVNMGGEETAASGTGSGIPGDPSGVPGLPQPAPADSQTSAQPPMDVVAVANGGQPGHIIIEEPVATEPKETPNAFRTLAQTDSVPMPEHAATPALMPYCHDDTCDNGQRMPYADEDEGGQEESELGTDLDVWGLLRQVAGEANAAMAELLPIAPKEVKEEDMSGDEQQDGTCPQDHDYHHQHDYQTCPYTGRTYELPKVSPPAPEMPPPEMPPPEMPHEKTDGNNRPKYHQSRKTSFGGTEDQEMPHLNLDTMEFRPSDAGFHQFTPGPF